MKSRTIITTLIIILVLAGAFFLMSKPSMTPQTVVADYKKNHPATPPVETTKETPKKTSKKE